MESFLVALNAVMPFLLYIGFGYGMQRTPLVDDAFLNRLNRMIFNAFFPIMMFQNLYSTPEGFSLDPKLAGFAVASLLTLQAILLIAVPRLVKENPKRGVIIQAVYRSNFVLFGIPLAASVFGEAGSTMATMMIALVIPIYNVTAVIILEMFRGGKVKPSVLVKNVCKNPMILGAVAGLIFYLLKIPLPGFLTKVIRQFSDLTTPMAMFVLGGTMHFKAVGGNARYLIGGIVTKLLILPTVIIAVATLCGISGVELFILMIMYATPTATASYAMAQNMGGDGELAGQLVVISTVVSVVTLFFWIFLLRFVGLI